ncbi:hypothetical protein D1114_03225 [Cereibacter sphaeroides]|uniref:Uncharacterized protein n=1 Tax=Cereibacter sphaeroides TaxID=1063 RepID=A0AAX1UQL6_CERSP|nr:hypothetical protein D1114_03225 [Cereibacter sphaeroides]
MVHVSLPDASCANPPGRAAHDARPEGLPEDGGLTPASMRRVLGTNAHPVQPCPDRADLGS